MGFIPDHLLKGIRRKDGITNQRRDILEPRGDGIKKGTGT
jgi:hypothetical protein